MVVSLQDLKAALIEGKQQEAEQLTQKAITEGISAKLLISDVIIPASKIIGEKFEACEYFLSELIQCGDTLSSIMKPVIRKLKEETGDEKKGMMGKIVLATVKGDIHDIGKNVVKMFLEGNGFWVEDIGVDVSADEIISKAVDSKAEIIALSCLMSVTRDGVKDVIKELKKRGLRDSFAVLVGGRSTDEEWAKTMGSDMWAADGPGAVTAAMQLIKKRG